MKNEIDIKTDLHLSALAMGYRNISENVMSKPVGYLCYLIFLNERYFRCDFYAVDGAPRWWSSHTFNEDDDKNCIEAICRAEYLEGNYRTDHHSCEEGKIGFEFLTKEQEWEFLT